MNDDETGDPETLIRQQLNQLVQEHADLDVAVQALATMPMPDMMVIARLKRKKLAMKDEIGRIESLLTPDIIA